MRTYSTFNNLHFDFNCKNDVLRNVMIILNKATSIKWGYTQIKTRVRYVSSKELPIRITSYRKKYQAKAEIILFTKSRNLDDSCNLNNINNHLNNLNNIGDVNIDELTYELKTKLLALLTSSVIASANNGETKPLLDKIIAEITAIKTLVYADDISKYNVVEDKYYENILLSEYKDGEVW
jgi:hypothetical protein